MAIDHKVIVAQIDKIVGDCEETMNTSKYANIDLSDLDDSVLIEMATLNAHTIDRFAPVGSQFNKQCEQAMKASLPGVIVKRLIGILKSLRTAYSNDYLQSVTELVHADVFSDFIEMADHLLAEGYKDPAAVMIGGVLEEHLRKVCDKNSVSTIDGNGKPKKASVMNDDLVKAGVYDKLEQKNVTAWLDLRNKAAHGEYSKYDKRHVEDLSRSVKNFLTRFRA
jgi:hypothetical protein